MFVLVKTRERRGNTAFIAGENVVQTWGWREAITLEPQQLRICIVDIRSVPFCHDTPHTQEEPRFTRLAAADNSESEDEPDVEEELAPEATSARDAFSTRAPAEIEPSNDSCFTNTSSAPLVVSFDCRLQLLPNANTWALIGEAVVQVRDVDVSNEKDERTAKLASAVHSTLVSDTCTAETDDVVCQLDDDELSKLTLTA